MIAVNIYKIIYSYASIVWIWIEMKDKSINYKTTDILKTNYILIVFIIAFQIELFIIKNG